MIVSMLGFFLAIRAELKKHTQQLIDSKLEEEKRHSRHEQRLTVIEQKAAYKDAYITERLDALTRRLGELYELFLEHLREEH